MWRRTPNGLSACGAPRHPARSVLASTPSTALAIGAKARVDLNRVIITSNNKTKIKVFQKPLPFPEVLPCRPRPQRPEREPRSSPYRRLSRPRYFDDPLRVRRRAETFAKHWDAIVTEIRQRRAEAIS